MHFVARKLILAASALVLAAYGVPLVATGAARAAARSAARAQAPPAQVAVVETTSDLLEHLTPMPSLSLTARRPGGVPLIRIDDLVRYQRFTGVGGAITDSSAWLIHNLLPPASRTFLMHALFGPGGVRLGFVRVPIGASDFTVGGTPYSYDDLPAGQSDPSLASFSIAHDEAYTIPVLRQILHLDPRAELFADPWTPPAWMKSNLAFDNRQHQGSLPASSLAPLADYFVRFLDAYAGQGIRISAIAPQNEPHAATAYPGTELPEPQEAQWIAEDLAPALSAAGLHPKIYGGDLGWGLPGYPQALIASEARSALAGIAWHCYGPDPTVLDALHAAAPELDQIVSECAPGIIPYPVAEVLIGSLRHWASAVSLWNVALDPRGGPVQPPNLGCLGCTGLVTIDERTHAVSFTLGYYQLGQVSEFVNHGAVRVASDSFTEFTAPAAGNDGVTPGLDDVAFLNPDGTRVLVAYNNSSVAVRFGVEWRRRFFSYTIAPRAMTTFEWR